ncbi:MAG TPA: ribonuclease E inhibitor RraB [Rheinheimera sp.]|uniref:ribonuclease E inhibitor RraB n=1 Tax=Rheinheimera sp. TaxID=1869214 RepID=UPI000EEB69F1|nr:ribonuclease E inhibitor RraB [Rheinheimera sp.]HCU67368.1 ribonuclease E inhibitor RraB [Rheinheimera sp.]
MSQFPDDGNGDMLQALADAGVDLSKSLELDFYLVFPDKQKAETALNALTALDEGGEVELNFNDLEQWELIVSLNMVPDHAAITAKEAELDKFAKKFGGYNDGWGVMQHQDGDDDFADDHECDDDCDHQH